MHHRSKRIVFLRSWLVVQLDVELLSIYLFWLDFLSQRNSSDKSDGRCIYMYIDEMELGRVWEVKVWRDAK